VVPVILSRRGSSARDGSLHTVLGQATRVPYDGAARAGLAS